MSQRAPAFGAEVSYPRPGFQALFE